MGQAPGKISSSAFICFLQFLLRISKVVPPPKKRKKPSINRLMKYENVYGPFNLPNCSSIIHLSDIQLHQQEFIPELPLFYDAFIIFVLLDTVYIFIS